MTPRELAQKRPIKFFNPMALKGRGVGHLIPEQKDQGKIIICPEDFILPVPHRAGSLGLRFFMPSPRPLARRSEGIEVSFGNYERVPNSPNWRVAPWTWASWNDFLLEVVLDRNPMELGELGGYLLSLYQGDADEDPRCFLLPSSVGPYLSEIEAAVSIASKHLGEKTELLALAQGTLILVENVEGEGQATATLPDLGIGIRRISPKTAGEFRLVRKDGEISGRWVKG